MTKFVGNNEGIGIVMQNQRATFGIDVADKSAPHPNTSSIGDKDCQVPIFVIGYTELLVYLGADVIAKCAEIRSIAIKASI
jgi:hypothetical protein